MISNKNKEKAVVFCFKLLSQHLSGVTEDICDKLWLCLLMWLKLNLGPKCEAAVLTTALCHLM
jgi:hypothetical protein